MRAALYAIAAQLTPREPHGGTDPCLISGAFSFGRKHWPLAVAVRAAVGRGPATVIAAKAVVGRIGLAAIEPKTESVRAQCARRHNERTHDEIRHDEDFGQTLHVKNPHVSRLGAFENHWHRSGTPRRRYLTAFAQSPFLLQSLADGSNMQIVVQLMQQCP
jgi:hypothetical protein